MPDEYSLVNKVAGRLFVQAGAKPRTALEIWSSAHVLLDPVLFKLFLLYYFLGLVQESSFFFFASSVRPFWTAALCVWARGIFWLVRPCTKQKKHVFLDYMLVRCYEQN